MTATLPPRSLLYVPASNPRAIEKARTLPCDAVILDLEDAVAPESKEDARRAAVAAVSHGGFGSRMLIVRANAADTMWGGDDLDALAGVRPDAVLIPKVDDGAAIMAAAARTGGAIPIWAMVETPLATLRLDSIAAAPALAALVLGLNDLALALGTRESAARTAFMPVLASTLAAARAFGRLAFDGVFNRIEDEDGLAAECGAAAALGYDGKTLIHPRQIGPANAAFVPGEGELAAARRIVEAFADPAAAGRGAILLDGRMVERLHLEGARRTLARARPTPA